MVNARLIWYLETNKLITEYQSGFRSQRSPMDHLIRLETFTREAAATGLRTSTDRITFRPREITSGRDRK